tara:strand:+ start:2856 stop:3215 length:360 start_codon:yes stop_codon:yes gene_type:complete
MDHQLHETFNNSILNDSSLDSHSQENKKSSFVDLSIDSLLNKKIDGFDLLLCINDAFKITIGVSFISYGFHIEKYNFKTLIKRTIMYTIFLLFYKHFVSNKINNYVNSQKEKFPDVKTI